MAAIPIDKLIPPPLARDERVRALLHAFVNILDGQADMALLMLNAANVPELAVPYLTFEHSLDEFIGPGLPVDVIRGMIENAWDLHEPKGYADGVEGGVAMLGLAATLIQWFMDTPRRRRGTHRIEVPVDKPIWPDRSEINAEDVRAIWRMIHAMQRWSQDHAVQFVAEASGTVTVAASLHTGFVVEIDAYDPGPVEVEGPLRIGAGLILSRTITVEGLQ